MPRFLRILVSAISFIVVVCVIAVGLIIYFVDPNSLKPLLIKEVAKTGYKLTIDGTMTWTVFPHVGINIPQLTLTEPQQENPFIELKNVKMVTPLTGVLHAASNLSGDLQIAEVNFMHLNLSHAKVSIHWRDQVLTLDPITATLYGGTVKGTADAKQLSATPLWSWQVKFNNIQINPLLADLSQHKSRLELSGLAQLKVEGTSSGKNKDTILQNLNGTTNFSMQQGMLEGINLDYFVQMADAILNHQSLNLPDNIKQTKFDQLTATANISNGVANTNNILLRSQTLTTTGQGNINLVNQTIDLRLTTKPQQQIKTQYEIPITITGSLNAPKIDADMREIEEKVAKQVIDRFKNRVEDKIGKFLGH